MEFKNIIYNIEDGIGILTINRPKAYNAMNTETNLEIEKLLEEIKEDESIRVLIITGSPKVFVAGADVTELLEADAQAAYNNCSLAHSNFTTIENLSIPVIAAINGPTLGGGCELALSCDFRIAGEGAFFGLPEITLGIIPGAGGTQRLAQLIGASRAKELIFTGKTVKAPKALEIGLITKMVEDGKVLDTAKEYAAMLCKSPKYALGLAKEAVNFGANYNLDTGRKYEQHKFALAFTSPDQKEGMTAFVEKRKPNFTNK